MLIGPASLLSLLKAIYQWVDETPRQKGPAQWFSTMNSHPNPNFNTRTTSSNNQEREEIPTGPQEVNLEDISIHFLCAYSTHPNWTRIVSTRNDYGQTLAHIAVTLGYFRLLQHLFKWQIDLDTVDSMGFSALHYAYLFKQEGCAKILIHSGVDRFILDDLGRSPADLDPSLEVRLRSIMEMEMGSNADRAPPIEYDAEMPDEAGKLYAKRFLILQWMREGEDARMGEAPLSSQSQIVEFDMGTQGMNEDLRELKECIEREDWFINNAHEPTAGAPESLTLADKYGIRGKSLFTAYVKENGEGVYGCVYEPCFAFSTRELEEAIRHIRDHHFNHSPFSCGQWYVSQSLTLIVSLYSVKD